MEWRGRKFCLVGQPSATDQPGMKMLGTEVECRKYRVAIALEREDKCLSMALTGPPSSIETEVRTVSGLVVGTTAAWQMAVRASDYAIDELHIRNSFRENQE